VSAPELVASATEQIVALDDVGPDGDSRSRGARASG